MKSKSDKCCNCGEQIIQGMSFPLMKESLCMGCFVRFGLARHLDVDILHYKNCSKLHCFTCEYAFYKALWAMDYKQTQMGNWYRCTSDPKVVRIYDELLTNLSTCTVSRLEGKL